MSIISSRIVDSYLETLLWSETLSACDEDGNSMSITIPEGAPGPFAGDTFEDGESLDSFLDTSDMGTLCPDVVAEVKTDLEAFGGYVEETLGFDPFEVFDADQVAQDFCLSRNGHGAGFFDGDFTHEGEQYCTELQAAAKTFGTLGLSVWVNDAGVLMVESHG